MVLVMNAMKNKLSPKTWMILILLIITLSLIFIPFETLIGKPSILGALLAKVYIKPLEYNMTCNMSLEPGWNLMSVACAPPVTDVETVLLPIENDYRSIHTYVTSETLDYWKVYNPTLPNWTVQDLTDISQDKGYWINMITSEHLNVTGDIVTPYSIALSPGWNLVGHPSLNNKTPPQGFQTIGGSYSIAWAYNASSSTYLYYNPLIPAGTLTLVRPGWGYWINMTQADVWWLT